MTLKIAENIKKLRIQKGFTQKQLADALGVTSGAVYKWESALSTPDILLIMELADFFEVSLDSLLGFEMKSGNLEAIKSRLVELRRSKKFSDAISECEKALQKYPNNFDIVYQSALIYELNGVEERNRNSTLRSIELYEKALLLLPQNDDPEISEFTINSSIAEGYMTAGMSEKGIELLKKCNIDGVYDAFIGMTYSFSSNTEEAEKGIRYLVKSFGHVVQSTFRTMLGFANVYAKRKDLQSSVDVMLWLINFLDSVRKNEDSVVYTEKLKAVLQAQCAIYFDVLGESALSDEFLCQAYVTAKRFDANPNYSMNGLRFCDEIEQTAVSYDDMGSSAIAAVENSISENTEYMSSKTRLLDIWNTMKCDE